MPTYLHTSTPARRAVIALAVVTLAAIIAAAVAASPFTSPARSEGRPAPLVGAMTHPLWEGPVEDFDRELDALKRAGATAVRIDLGWVTLEEGGKGRYSDWYVEKADTFFDHAQARGLKVVVTLWGSPCWASSAPSSVKQDCSPGWWERGAGAYAPRDPSDYADGAAWVARRWGSKIAALEVWNEPNIDVFMNNEDAAGEYAAILKAAYPKVKAAAPSLPVLGAVLAGGDEEFLRQLYSHGIKGHHDGISIHPYDAADPSKRPNGEFLTSVPGIRAMMVERGEGSQGLWLTEVGFSTCNADFRCATSEQRQSDYTAAVIRKAATMPYVRAVLVYNLRNKGNDRGDFEQNFGLVRRDFSPKPGFTGFKQGVAAVAGTGPTTGGETPPPSRSSGAGVSVRPTSGSVRVGSRGQTRLLVTCSSKVAASKCAGLVHLEVVRPQAASDAGARPRIGRRSPYAVSRGGKRAVEAIVRPRTREILARRGSLRVRAVATRGSKRVTSAPFLIRRR